MVIKKRERERSKAKRERERERLTEFRQTTRTRTATARNVLLIGQLLRRSHAVQQPRKLENDESLWPGARQQTNSQSQPAYQVSHNHSRRLGHFFISFSYAETAVACYFRGQNVGPVNTNADNKASVWRVDLVRNTQQGASLEKSRLSKEKNTLIFNNNYWIFRTSYAGIINSK